MPEISRFDAPGMRPAKVVLLSDGSTSKKVRRNFRYTSPGTPRRIGGTTMWSYGTPDRKNARNSVCFLVGIHVSQPAVFVRCSRLNTPGGPSCSNLVVSKLGTSSDGSVGSDWDFRSLE